MKISEFQKILNKNDQLVINMEIALIVAGVICVLLNAVTFQYQGDHYLSLNWLWATPALLVIALTQTGYLLKSYSLYFLAFFAFLVLLNGIQYTPFPTIDPLLAKADSALNISEKNLIDLDSCPSLFVTHDAMGLSQHDDTMDIHAVDIVDHRPQKGVSRLPHHHIDGLFIRSRHFLFLSHPGPCSDFY